MIEFDVLPLGLLYISVIDDDESDWLALTCTEGFIFGLEFAVLNIEESLVDCEGWLRFSIMNWLIQCY